MRKTNPDDVPIVRLAKGGFKHKDDRIGWVNVPVFVVVGKAPRDGVASPDNPPPDTTLPGLLDDEIPQFN